MSKINKIIEEASYENASCFEEALDRKTPISVRIPLHVKIKLDAVCAVLGKKKARFTGQLLSAALDDLIAGVHDKAHEDIYHHLDEKGLSSDEIHYILDANEEEQNQL